MGEPQDTDDKKALAEKILAWASVAYGFGFTVVLLHTARLGVPVLELVKPIYILIGLPLAIVLFFSRQIVKSLRLTAGEHRDELIDVLKREYITESDEQNRAVEKLILAISNTMFWYIPSVAVRRLLNKLFERNPSEGDRARTMRILDRSARALRAYGALTGFLRLASTVIGSGFLIFLYVWVIYPTVPMEYGGGAPTSVQLLVDASKVPPALSQTMGAIPAQSGTSSLTADLELLYVTSTAYLVRLRTGSIVALDKEAVNGVIFPGKPQP